MPPLSPPLRAVGWGSWQPSSTEVAELCKLIRSHSNRQVSIMNKPAECSGFLHKLWPNETFSLQSNALQLSPDKSIRKSTGVQTVCSSLRFLCNLPTCNYPECSKDTEGTQLYKVQNGTLNNFMCGPQKPGLCLLHYFLFSGFISKFESTLGTIFPIWPMIQKQEIMGSLSLQGRSRCHRETNCSIAVGIVQPLRKLQRLCHTKRKCLYFLCLNKWSRAWNDFTTATDKGPAKTK